MGAHGGEPPAHQRQEGARACGARRCDGEPRRRASARPPRSPRRRNRPPLRRLRRRTPKVTLPPPAPRPSRWSGARRASSAPAASRSKAASICTACARARHTTRCAASSNAAYAEGKRWVLVITGKGAPARTAQDERLEREGIERGVLEAQRAALAGGAGARRHRHRLYDGCHPSRRRGRALRAPPPQGPRRPAFDERLYMMLQALIGMWIGSSTLLFVADGTFYLRRGNSARLVVARRSMSIENGEILFDVSPIKGSRDAEQLLVPHGAFRCAYALSGDALSLSNCPYAGDYAAFRSRRGRR